MMRSRNFPTRSILTAVALVGLLVVAASVAAPASRAQEDAGPGVFPFWDLGLFADETVNVDINLPAPMIRLVAGMIGEEDPDLAALVGGIVGIRAQVVEGDIGDRKAIHERLLNAVSWLETGGWKRIVMTREVDEEVHIFVQEDGETFAGIAVLALEDDEALAVNIVGTIDPEEFGRFMARDEFSDVRGLLGD